jgi:hypothetical protein
VVRAKQVRTTGGTGNENEEQNEQNAKSHGD